jgi:hypothetical protein
LKNPVDVTLDQEGQEIDARGRDGDVGRERDHRPSRRFCDRRRRPHIVGEYGPEDELRPRSQLRLSRLGGRVGARVIILDHERDGGRAGIVDRELRRVAHRDADRAWSPVLGEREDHADPNRACAQRFADGRSGGRLSRRGGGAASVAWHFQARRIAASERHRYPAAKQAAPGQASSCCRLLRGKLHTHLWSERRSRGQAHCAAPFKMPARNGRHLPAVDGNCGIFTCAWLCVDP